MENQLQQLQIKKQGYSLDITVDPFNRRVRVDDYLGNFDLCVAEAMKLAVENTVEKLIFKARVENFQDMVSRGFLYEGSVDKYFLGSDCFFFAKYFILDRRNSDHWIEEDRILNGVLSLLKKKDYADPPLEYKIRKADEADAMELARLYGKVFEIYPVPMNDPEYVIKCMKAGTVFYVYEWEGHIVSAASAEVNYRYHHAEITDCATLPDHRQFGLIKLLISQLEKYLADQEIFCVYSISRALSFGMNAVFFQLGYGYRGRLANNCYIFDKIEDMNLWVKIDS
ncbi:putative beta-lysine N-acetyltransferase [Peribacillus cavernae]|uniref:Putative beta-lysine N-acetyltransferase n=1 Tax=Peribacillus cavernae TaxID=1674310 RepID=A0A3S0W4W1_9BACI|nr:putative beta-lysine N-acetyltransferase [Peribacillus cavernae]MDQ0217953.1 putative beta-lysine N-acetyltransferase [Peribacillus cavernae]RUQ32600.1 putative beta-lysine N-acetyltransferase [Peribacillus cavernae]